MPREDFDLNSVTGGTEVVFEQGNRVMGRWLPDSRSAQPAGGTGFLCSFC